MTHSLAIATDPNSWPPRNTKISFDWTVPTHQVYREDDGDDDDDDCKVENTAINGDGIQHATSSSDENDRKNSWHGAASATTALVHFQNHIFSPTFASARSRLDYSYHTNLVYSRQLLQDAILERVVTAAGTTEVLGSTLLKSYNSEDLTGTMSTMKGEENSMHSPPDQPASPRQVQRPWIVFTAGAMGVGKGYVLMQLHQANLLPNFESFVKIDPDMMKSELPEMAGYLCADRETAASKLHRESTQMADVLFEHAVANHLPVLVDGSLRDVAYYQELFDRIHGEFPAYRIAILHVTADREVIMQRAAARAEKTGRVVPLDLLDESIRQVPASVEALSHTADVVHVIANNEGQPLQLLSSTIKIEAKDATIFTAMSRLDERPTWEDFARSWMYAGDAVPEEDTADNAVAVSDDKDKTYASATDRYPILSLPTVQMSTVFECTTSHAAANEIWKNAYPNFCARCCLSCDRQCGICIHGRHFCACTVCKPRSESSACGGGEIS